MIVRRIVSVLVVVTAVGVVAVVAASAAPRDDRTGASLIGAARDAVTRYAFTGVVVVEWVAAGKSYRERVPVRDDGGMLVLGSSRRVMGTGSESLVHETNGWFGLSDEGSVDTLPDPSDHYDLTVEHGPTVAGRTTTLVTAVSHADASVQERLYFDDETGILLRREQRDGKRTERSVGFVEISSPVMTTVAPPSPPSDARTAKKVAPTSLGRSWKAPRSLSNGFELVDAYRQSDGSMQLYYSDGLVGMSVFESKGPLDTGALPRGGRAMKVGGRRAHVYETAGGDTVVWDGGELVYSCVTDASLDRVGALVAKLPSHHRDGIVAKVTHFVLGPFSWE